MFVVGTTEQVINQRYLERTVQALFPTENIHTNARKAVALSSPSSGTALEVDVWVPSLQLCFEFQDEYHYNSAFYSHTPLEVIREHDNSKRAQLQEKRETLIVIPYWWQGDCESLQATIEFQRPDLSIGGLLTVPPISFNPSHSFFQTIPGIGELMLASFPVHMSEVLSAKKLWWLGEKYDGIRFCWHPEDHVVYSRTGWPLPVSQKFVHSFGHLFIDGEFWCGRGKFSDSVNLISQPQLDMSLSRFVGFDVPNRRFSNKPFEFRYAALIGAVPADHPLLTIAFRVACHTRSHLHSWLRDINDRGGEGVILRSFASQYLPGRSSSLLKLKVLASDAEALVVKSTASHVRLQLPNGYTFTLARQEEKLRIVKGDVVQYSFTKQTQNHVPIDPVFSRVRKDITWQQAQSQFNKHKAKSKNKPKSLPVASKQQRLRSFFEDFAKKKGFDPLVAHNWYHVSRKEMMQEYGILTNAVNKSLIHALTVAFPQIGLDSSKFMNLPLNFWKDELNRKKFVISFAKQAGFDPLIAKNWYSVTSEIVSKLANTAMVKTYYGGNLSKCIHHLFPDIGLSTKQLFYRKPMTKNEIRQRLIEFARMNSIDPFVASEWYQFRFDKLRSPTAIRTIIGYYYGDSWTKCLVDIFDELNLDILQFRHHAAPQYTKARI